jgi:hypothetical protein
MTISKTLRIAVLSAAVLALPLSDILSSPVPFSVISSAEARVGRPLTPVSVAGVARRTARRCAADVYDC